MDLSREHRSPTSILARRPGLRWWVAILLFFATLINFLNRLTIAVLSPVIMAQMHLSSSQFASLTTSFLLAYTISQGLSGKLFDVIGTKLGFVISVSAWSIISMVHAFARGLASLDSLRFLLGMAEGGTWPGAAKAIAEWFPVPERALAMGICNSGTALGSLISTPLLIWIELRFGWRVTFIAVGLPGLLWVLLWTTFYRHPEHKPGTTSNAMATIHADRAPAPQGGAIGWREILRRREAWAIMLARLFGDPIWWFYITWLPLYLFKVRHFSLQQIGMFAWMPFVAADAGSIFGGWLSGFLIRSGWSVDGGRKTVITGATAFMLCGIPAAMTHSSVIALVLIAFVLFGFQSWIGNVQTLCSDYFPQAAVGSVMGLGGVGAGLGAMFLTELTGFVVDHFSYRPILTVAGLLPVIATAVLYALGGTVRPISPLEFAGQAHTEGGKT